MKRTEQKAYKGKISISTEKRKAFVAFFLAYLEYALTCNPFVIPTKGISTGTFGRCFELVIKYLLGNIRGNVGVSACIGKDTYKTVNGKKYKIEIKQACGLVGLSSNGVDWDLNTLLDSDIIVYNLGFLPTMSLDDVKQTSRVIPTIDFTDFLLDDSKRKKWHINNSKNEQRNTVQMQSFKNSKSALKDFTDFLEQYPTFSEFFGI